MSASQVQILNLAFLKFGNISIQAITDTTPQARFALVLWDIIRDELLFSYPWNFAMKRDLLDTPSAVLDDPLDEYAYIFTLPSDCLRVWDIYNSDAKYTIEGGVLYTNDEEIGLKYVAKITDVSLFPPPFVTSFSIRMAAELSAKLTDNAKIRASLMQEFAFSIQQAYKLNAIEGNPARHKDEQNLSKGNLEWQKREG